MPGNWFQNDEEFLAALADRLESHLEPMREALVQLRESGKVDSAYDSLQHQLRELDQLREHLENLSRLPGPRRRAAHGRVLVVDDDRDWADNLAALLRREGYSVTVAYSGREALEAAGTAMPDAVVLDIKMPSGSGYDAARVFRRHPAGTRPVLIGVTQWQIEDSDRRVAKEAGFDHFLPKPGSDAALAELLQKIGASREGARPV